MNTRIKKQIEALAKASPTVESCGFIYHTLDSVEIFPCVNISSNTTKEFEISPDDYIACLQRGKPCAIYHSDPNIEAAFSESDLHTADEWILPLYLYAINEDQWSEFIPAEYRLPYETLPFIWGLYDCYELVRIYLRQERQIYLGDYDRDESFENDDGKIILDNFDKEGYYNTGTTVDFRKNDVFLFHSNRACPQHFGIFLGHSKILHHPLGGLSRIETLSNRWLSRLQYVLRYKKD